MAFWNADLTTRMGAESAADNGGLACFIYGGFSVLGIAFFGSFVGYDTPEGLAILAATGVQVLVAILAGFRLRSGKGAFWGIAVAVLMTLDLIGKLISLAIGVGLVVNVILLIVLIQGVRGAWALRSGVGFDEDDTEAFE